ncbi:hypothetical protein VDGL01_09944 [Verticillium dahliae]
MPPRLYSVVCPTAPSLSDTDSDLDVNTTGLRRQLACVRSCHRSEADMARVSSRIAMPATPFIIRLTNLFSYFHPKSPFIQS